MNVRFAFLTVLLCFAWTHASAAQKALVRTVASSAEGVVVEVTVDWPAPMQALADSLALESFTIASGRALSFGLPVVSETLELPSRDAPSVSLLASAWDELDLPPGDTLAAGEASGPVAWLDGLGASGGRALINLNVRLLAYEAGSVRRYRQARIAVRYASGGGVQGLNARIASSRRRDNPHLAVTGSVLANGVAYKIPVRATGLYRIDRDFLAGLPDFPDPDAIDPDRVAIYGNGGAPVPALNSDPRIADLAEQPAWRTGGGDGRFDAGDAVIFYGKGPYGWTYGGEEWEHYVHPYSSENYYFVKILEEDAATPVMEPFPTQENFALVSEAEGRHMVDFDEFMWSKLNGTGHTWVSATLRSGESRVLVDDLTLSGRAEGVVRYRARVAIRSNPADSVRFESDGAYMGSLRAPSAVGFEEETHPVAVSGIAGFERRRSANDPVNLSIRLHGGPVDETQAAVDWLRIFYPQRLRANGDSLHFSTPRGQAGNFEFALEGFTAAPLVWDVTHPGQVRRLEVRQAGNAWRVRVQVPDVSVPLELTAFRPSAARSLRAETAQRAAPQNLHGVAGYPDFVIIAPDVFRTAAEELAEHRRQEGLDVLVTDIRAIYNEFSGGLMDVRGIRDYLRFLYDRGNEAGQPLRYALFFGDGHFNYRNLNPGNNPVLENWIPPYETEDSFHPLQSYASDDYFGLLDADEGVWRWPGSSSGAGRERMDIGVGRFPVQTPEEAAVMVAKIKHYEDAATYGSWRNRYLFVADDGYNGTAAVQENAPDLHTQNADVVAELLAGEYPQVDLVKVYGIAYKREFLSSWRLPGVESDIRSALDDGVLVMNYSGHGREDGLAQENIFTLEDARELRNYDRLPLFITATCSYGWWDLSGSQSAGEVLLLNEAGGAIALMATVRLVVTRASLNDLNVGLNRALNRALFKPAEDGGSRRLGDAMLEAKNSRAGLQGNNRKFNLLGDPTLRLGYPSRGVVVERVNGTPVADMPRIRALDKITVEGYVGGPDGTVDSGFEGQAHLVAFDAARRVRVPQRVVMPRDYYTIRGDLLWRGGVPVTAGRFTATFVAPKDISYSNEPGRLSVYARNASRHTTGFTEQVVVGGTADVLPDDQAGPEISLFLNDTTFVSGGLTPANPRLIVKLRDESGVNTAGTGVGHEMLLVVDGDERSAVNIGSRFESDPGSFRSGRVEYSFRDYPDALVDGPHSLSVRAWDVLNNSNAVSLDFVVASTEDVVLDNVYNYPNPTSGQTRFVFEHNQPPGTVASVQVRIYALSGRPVRTIDTEEALPSGALAAGPVQVLWDGRDEDMNLLASGIYLYKVRVRVDNPDGGRSVSERIEKLAVIR